ncbi:hypothetical protein EVA_01328 [gut metagenome]|uniref:Uncharacterized protein n=1 Tax=gut metagenome TaxID=749906 RepID=J9GQ31_9ZZZZ
MRIRWIGHHRIHIKRFAYLRTFCKNGPVLIQRVCTTSVNVIRNNTTHHKVHTRQVVGVLLQLLRIILHTVLVLNVLTDGLTYSDQQRTGTTGGVVNFQRSLILVMFCHDFRHEDSYFMRRIELTRLFPCIGSKVTDQILIHIAQHVVVLTAIGGNILDQFDKPFQRLGLCRGIGTQFAQSGLQGFEDVLIHTLVLRTHQAVETVEGCTQVAHVEIAVALQPSAKEVLVLDKVADVVLTEINHHHHLLVIVIFYKVRQVFIRPVIFILQVAHLIVRKELVENQAKDIILVFVCLNL